MSTRTGTPSGPHGEAVTLTTVLEAVTRERLYDLARVFGVRLQQGRETKRTLVKGLSGLLQESRLPDVLRELGREELRAVCRAHSLPAEDAAREALVRRLAEAAGLNLANDTQVRSEPHAGSLPQPGQVLRARSRQWLVEGVVNGGPGDSPLLRLACLEDDAPGRRLELLWDLELGARVVAPEAEGLGKPRDLDPPGHFGAYLHALKWSAVSAADATRFQAPFRAGIKLMAHQLTPLMKALELPRANLFIADDVGLGKTIEAGLVLQELILRQQAGFVLIVCPASICLQWRDEMMRRFGLRFEVMSLKLIARRRIERGFGVNPWATHNRFIVSHPLIRRPEYRDPLLAHLGQRAEKGLLILDEAHVAAPASASKYAVDSDTTRTLRDLAPKFDNRLFLSATPHNGHSNSFSALLELLDPIRFTRGVTIPGPEVLAPVMVRRLKRDLRELGCERFPERVLTRIELTHAAEEGWRATEERSSDDTQAREPARPLASSLGGDGSELELSGLLARYTELCAPGQGRGRLVFVSLQKRLLSSPEAFARTLEVHARAVERAGGVRVVLPERPPEPEAAGGDAEVYGESDAAAEAEHDAAVSAASLELPTPTEEAAGILRKMRALAERARREPDGKMRALLAWLRLNACPAIGIEQGSRESGAWSERRVIVFTEYGDTKRYLQEILATACAATERGEERILVFHGGMGDETRDEVQRAFNAPPSEHPVRILIGTDAAREGVNLQAHCADLFHYDVPWNPARMEQRNGRIDRTLQPAREVRCHYFVYAQRDEDRVLETLVRKVETVRRELGSVGAVVLDEMERVLEGGIKSGVAERIEAAGRDARSRTATEELESQRRLDLLEAELQRASRRLESSRRALEVDAAALRGVVEVGLQLGGAEGLSPGPDTSDGRASYHLPELDRSWQATLDTLRPPRGRDEPFWEWRSKPPRAVTFEPLESLNEEAEQLHLAHPVVKRILDRFLAQGYGAHDLSRVAAVVVPGENVSRVVAYARLTLFGNGAARLHDEIVSVAAPWSPGADGERVVPYKDPVTAARARELTERALATAGGVPAARIRDRALAAAPGVFAALWPHLEAEADARATEARNGLARRARKESEELKVLLERQRRAVAEARLTLSQRTIDEVLEKTQRRQVELDLEYLEAREGQMAADLEREPAAIEALYAVRMTRLTPVGVVIAWPESMT